MILRHKFYITADELGSPFEPVRCRVKSRELSDEAGQQFWSVSISPLLSGGLVGIDSPLDRLLIGLIKDARGTSQMVDVYWIEHYELGVALDRRRMRRIGIALMHRSKRAAEWAVSQD